MNVDEERVMKLADRMTSPLPSYKEGQINHVTKIIINEAPLDKQQNQRNHYQNNFSGEIKQYAQPSLDTVVSTFNIAKQEKENSAIKNENFARNNSNHRDVYLGANNQSNVVKPNSNQSSNKENKGYMAESNLNLTQNNTSLHIDDIQQARTGYAEYSMNDDLQNNSEAFDPFGNNDALSKRKYLGKDIEMNIRQSEKRLKIEKNTTESKEILKIKPMQIEDDANMGTNSNSETWNNNDNIIISKTQVKMTDFFRSNGNKKLGDASPIFGNFEKKKDCSKKQDNNISKNLKLQFLNFNSDCQNRENQGENSFGFNRVQQMNQPALIKHSSVVNNLSRPSICQDNYILELKEKHEKEINYMSSKISSLEKFLNDKKNEIEKMDDELRLKNEKQNEYKESVKKLLCKIILQVEDYTRQDKKSYVTHQKNRIGESINIRDGTKNKECWQDGWELRKLKSRLEEIKVEKEEQDKVKKSLKMRKSDRNGLTIPSLPKSISEDIFGLSASKEGTIGYDNTLYSGPMIEKNILEAKDRISAQFMTLTREEENLKETYTKLETEKVTYIQEAKRLYEEQHSRFGKPISLMLRENNDDYKPWPVQENRYQLCSLLGKGGFSEVYKGFDLDSLKYVASKIHQLNPNWNEQSKSNYIKHALRENNVHRKQHHPNIVAHYDSVEIDSNSFCTVLEYCEGPDLSHYLKRHKVLSEKEAKNIIKQILSGIKFLSEKSLKVIHYDLKPQNILFHKGLVKISDFGLCKIMNDEETKMELTSQGVGTYWYLPPECFDFGDNPPKISPKVDVWSIGVMFYEMVFGQRPFGHGMSQERILKEGVMLRAKNVVFPTSGQKVSQEVKDIIKKCLEYHPEERYCVLEAYNAQNRIHK